MNRLQGKIAVITGGTSGIGLAAAEAFLREGARVVFTGRDQKNADHPSGRNEAADGGGTLAQFRQ